MKKEITKEEAKQKLQDEAKKITEEDLKKVIDKADEIKEKFEGKGPLGRFISDVKLMISLIKDYYDGKYRKIPFYSIAAIIAALLYVFNPFDIIPDAIPVVGLVDDALVVGACLLLVEQDLMEYKEWKLKNA